MVAAALSGVERPGDEALVGAPGNAAHNGFAFDLGCVGAIGDGGVFCQSDQTAYDGVAFNLSAQNAKVGDGGVVAYLCEKSDCVACRSDVDVAHTVVAAVPMASELIDFGAYRCPIAGKCNVVCHCKIITCVFVIAAVYLIA